MLRKFMLGAATVALLAGAFAAPAAAVPDADVAWINGLPGKIDICVGKNEIVSKLGYGRAAFHTGITPGTYKFIIRKAKFGKCKGTRIGTAAAKFVEGGDHTAVIWRPFSKVKIKTFKNDTSVEVGTSSISYRHVARMSVPVDVWLWQHVKPAADDFPPTFNNVRRGTATPSAKIAAGQYSLDTFPSRRTRLFSWEGYWSRTDVERFIEVYLIGTTKANMKVVAISQLGDPIFLP